MADQIIVLDGDDEEESPKPLCTASISSSQPETLKSPLASAKKDTHVLQEENSKLFTEFVDYCSAFTQDHPQVLPYIQTRYSKASPDYLSSVEFRNTMGSCLTRAKKNHSKTFVYIIDLCNALMAHSAKKMQMTTKAECGPCASTSSSHQATSVTLPKEDGKGDKEDQEVEKNTNRASRKQIAYLENLLKEFHEEIRHLQRAELSLDDLDSDTSSYMQEHKLKRKMMKVFNKLCELKGCSKRTGRVIEQRIPFNGTRYPEINKRVERFINSPEAHKDMPDYQDILQQVIRANERYNLCLKRQQLNQIAKEAFGDVGTRLKDRRILDMVYNFGTHLTDKPCKDPAQLDSSLKLKLKSNREVALSRLEEVISKYAKKQEEKEQEKEGCKSEEGEGNNKVNGVAEEVEEEEEEEEEDEEDVSSDPDIEEELLASTRQDGPDSDENENGSIKAEQACDETNTETQTDEVSGSVSTQEDEIQEPIANGLGPISDESNFQISPPLSDIPSLTQSPSQSEQTNDQRSLSNGSLDGLEEPMDSSHPVKDSSVTPAAANRAPLPLSSEIVVEKYDTQTTTNNSTSTPSSPRALRSRKRKREREEMTSGNPIDTKNTIIHDSEVDIPLDMDVVSCSSPQQAQSTRANTPIQELVTICLSTPPPKKNKVNVATQCDPDEIIVLSDSE